jgi:hypothetical protein
MVDTEAVPLSDHEMAAEALGPLLRLTVEFVRRWLGVTGRHAVGYQAIFVVFLLRLLAPTSWTVTRHETASVAPPRRSLLRPVIKAYSSDVPDVSRQLLHTCRETKGRTWTGLGPWLLRVP